jgi:hypothetical protein
MKLRVVLLAGVAVLSACSSARPFTDVVGNVRVSGDVQEDAFSRETGTVNVQLYDVSTGYPVDASDVQVRAGREAAVHATRKQLGVYSANIANRRHIDLFITTRDNRSIFLALQQR